MRVNEIFYSLQGEGYWTGVPAVFVRLAGCNLKCPFCDTSHEKYVEMSEYEIVERVSAYPATHVVITGGEPSLQLSVKLAVGLKRSGFYIQIETNGSVALSNELLNQIDWVTCSPKCAPIAIGRIDELKVLFSTDTNPSKLALSGREWLGRCRVLSLQPCDMGDAILNRKITCGAIEFVKTHPEWRLSLQIHKLLNIR